MKLFLDPREDETLYSLVTRIQTTTGWSNGLMHREYPFLGYLPTTYRNLALLPEFVPPHSALATEDILCRRTTFGALTFNLDKKETETLRQEFCLPHTPTQRGRRWGRPVLKSCPECVAGDADRYGEAHWRRLHQATTVTACPTHGCRLRETLAVDGRSGLSLPTDTGGTEAATDAEITHALTVEAILDGLRVEPKAFGQLVSQRLVEMGLAHESPKSTKMLQAELNTHVLHQPAVFLKEMGFKTKNWGNHLRLTEIMNGLRPNSRRALGLVFLTRLKAADLLRGPRQTSFYPCRNKLAGCYLKPLAEATRRANKTTRVECRECGYEYIIPTDQLALNTPDQDLDTTSHRPGPVWEARFKDLWGNPSIKNKELWEICGLGRSQTDRQGARLGLPRRDHAWWKAVRKSGKAPR